MVTGISFRVTKIDRTTAACQPRLDEYLNRVFLIPDGFSGVVVVVYEEAGGIVPVRDGDGRDVLRVPSDGVLRLRRKAPAVVGGKDIYFLVRADGTRARLLAGRNQSPRMYQAFGNTLGGTTLQPVTTTLQDGSKAWVQGPESPPGKTCEIFMVGVPESRNDWTEIRDTACDSAVYGKGGAPWLRSYE